MSRKVESVTTHCPGEKIDPRVRRTRDLIVRALKDLLAESRFADITVQDIAEKATVNRATFYSHFEDKYALLEEMMGADLRHKLIAKITPGTPFNRDNLKTFAVATFEFFGQMQTSCTHKREFGPVFEPTMQATLEDFLVHWIRHNPGSLIAHGQPEDTVSGVYSWAIFGAANSWSRLEKRPKVEEAVERLLSVLIPGPL